MGMMFVHSDNFCLKQSDAIHQLMLGIAIKAFAGKLAGNIAIFFGQVMIHSDGSIHSGRLAVNGAKLYGFSRMVSQWLEGANLQHDLPESMPYPVPDSIPNFIPNSMTAIAITELGGPDVLVPENRPLPVPAADEVLIKVAYAGVNRPDCLQRAGLYPAPKGASDLPGLEISGSIVAAGENVPDSVLGQSVCALTNGGGYAQYCAVSFGQCLAVPQGLSLAQAAAMPETLFTVWHNVFVRGWAKDGETLLVHGGTSGIGTMAIKLAKLFDMTVIVTCGTDGKCDAALALGADRAINYRKADFVEEIQKITGGKGVDITLDMVAGEYTQRNLDCLSVGGRLVTIAVLGGAKSTINMGKFMVRRQTMTGSTLRARSDEFKAALCEDITANVWPAVMEGDLQPAMDKIFPLEQAAQAHRRMEAGDHIGKIVLKV